MFLLFLYWLGAVITHLFGKERTGLICSHSYKYQGDVVVDIYVDTSSANDNRQLLEHIKLQDVTVASGTPKADKRLSALRETVKGSSVSQTITNMFKAYSNRPCIGSQSSQDLTFIWRSYQEIYNEARAVAAFVSKFTERYTFVGRALYYVVAMWYYSFKTTTTTMTANPAATAVHYYCCHRLLPKTC